MKAVRTAAELDPRPRAVAIGVFDGVHRGHQAVLKAVVEQEPLLERLRAGDLRAAIDVYQPEPPPPDSPWRQAARAGSKRRWMAIMSSSLLKNISKRDQTRSRSGSPNQAAVHCGGRASKCQRNRLLKNMQPAIRMQTAR